jgi:hypothetical protein
MLSNEAVQLNYVVRCHSIIHMITVDMLLSAVTCLYLKNSFCQLIHILLVSANYTKKLQECNNSSFPSFTALHNSYF